MEITTEDLNRLYEITSIVFLVLLQAITALCLVKLYGSFLKHPKKKRKIWMPGAVYFLISTAFFLFENSLGNYIAYIVAFLGSFLLYLLLDHGNIRLKTLLAVTFFVVRWVSFSMAAWIGIGLNDLGTMFLEKHLDFSNAGFWRYYFLLYLAESVLELMICFGVQAYFVRKLCAVFLHKRREISGRALLILLIPSLVGLASYGILQVYIAGDQEQAGNFLYLGQPVAGVLWLLYDGVLLAAILSTIISWQKLQEKQELQMREQMLETTVKDIQMHMEETEALYAQMRGMRHDMKNHISVMAGLLEQGKLQEAIAYLEPMRQITELPEQSVRTGNPVTDRILNEKLKEAKQQGIRFQSEFYYPAESGLDAFDVSVILSNALTNAMEAAEPGGLVEISSFRNKQAYLITVQNSFGGQLEVDAETGLPETTKYPPELHGIGLKNIRSTAEKYHGDILLEQQGQSVVLTVLLMLPKTSCPEYAETIAVAEESSEQEQA